MQETCPWESRTNAVAIYIGHEACADTLIGHMQHPYAGLAWRESNIVALNDWGTDDYNAFVLIHEFGHLFGVIDHNIEGETENLNYGRTSNLYNDYCIYGFYRDTTNVINNQTICAGCRETIRQYAAVYYKDIYEDL